MLQTTAFELVREEQIKEINSLARLYRHKKTGAEVLSLINDDENKVFGIVFKTPPEDSTGIAHILEHSVLCGSRKYPVKEPFVELLKGSLHTFLNAMTFPDKTAYPVASQNLKDFYNLVDVYLDAVFFPLITEDTFRQEGWHYELEGGNAPLNLKGVVFNEMKGAYSSPAAVLHKASQQSLYPDTTYGVDSGGDPKAIPQLTYEQFKAFHQRYYHPSNARIVFYGDDDPEQRLAILESYLSQFERSEVDPQVPLQQRFPAPRTVNQYYAASPAEGNKRTGMVTVNWMLEESLDAATMLRLGLLEHVLLGTTASPLRKALTDSGLGEGLTGSGIADDLRQPMFTVGLKGIEEEDGPKVEALVLETLERLAREGIDKQTIEASVNTIEFALREQNTGSFPRGMSLMFRSLRSWLYGGDPLAPLSFEEPLKAVKAELAEGKPVLETMVRELLLDNPHRTTVLLKADPELAAREAAEERAKLDAVRAGLDEAGLKAIEEATRKLKALQEAADPPEALAKIPTLTLADLPRQGKTIPTDLGSLAGTTVLYHDLPTNGVLYLDLAFELHGLPAELLPYVPLFARALLQTGTSKEDFVSLNQRIGRSTGGIGISPFVGTRQENEGVAARLVVRAKAVPDKADELLAILMDVLTDARLDNRQRLLQMALEEKAAHESRLAGAGNAIASMRLRSSFTEADWVAEQLHGVSYLFFVRQLIKEIEADWAPVQAKFEAIRDILISRAGLLANVTAEGGIWRDFAPRLEAFLAGLADKAVPAAAWLPVRRPAEGLTFPAQVNYVAKGANLRDFGVDADAGGLAVALRHLNTTYLWDKVRVQGGAYGGGAALEPDSGFFTFSSYRDPNLLATLEIYDQAPGFLRRGVGEQDLTRSIIGVIGTIDRYMLPDAKGYTAMVRHLLGYTEETRQRRREQILGATAEDFRTLADALEHVAREGHVVVLGSEKAIREANEERGPFLEVTRVL